MMNIYEVQYPYLKLNKMRYDINSILLKIIFSKLQKNFIKRFFEPNDTDSKMVAC